MGWSTPETLIDAASSRIASSSKRTRGWWGLGATSSTRTSIGAPGFGSAVDVPGPAPGISASSPLPNTFLCMLQNLPSELSIALRAAAVGVVEHDGFAERGGFTESNIAGNDASVDPLC